MDRPKTLHIGETAYWTMRVYDSAGALTDADSTPTVAVRRDGASTADSVTVTKRSATTGIYDCSYNPAAESEGEAFTMEESVTVSSTAYSASWEMTAVAVERGTDSAPTAVAIRTEMDSNSTQLAALTSRLTAARAGYLDNLNVGGAVASQADINALNQSASRRIILTTVGQYERPESGSVTYTVEARTYDGDGAPVAADSTPTITATGITSGDLTANLSAATNPSTGVYRWTYTVDSVDTLEQLRYDVTATLSAVAFPMSVYTQVADFVAANFSTADRVLLQSAKDDLDLITGADGVQLDTTQPNYQPAKAGDEMDLVGAPNATAVGAIQSGLSTLDSSAAQSAAAAALAGYDPPTRAEATADKDEILARGSTGPWTTGAGGPGGGGDATEAKQDQILGALAGTVIKPVSPVRDGGTIVLVQGDDYTGANAITLPAFSDPSSVVHDLLAAADDVVWAGGDRSAKNLIVGTVSSTHDGGTEMTTVTISIDQADNTVALGDYAWQIQATTSGKRNTEFEGCLEVGLDVAG